MLLLFFVSENQKTKSKTKVKNPTLRRRRGGWGTRKSKSQKKIACDEPTESLPSGDFVLIQFFEGLMPSVTGAQSSSGGSFDPLITC